MRGDFLFIFSSPERNMSAQHEVIALTKRDYLDLLARLYDECPKDKFILRNFQDKLESISRWSDSKKKEVAASFHIDELTPLVQELASPLRVRVDDYVYESILNVAREIYTKSFLFYHRVNPSEYQERLMMTEKIIKSEIKHTLRHLEKVSDPALVESPREPEPESPPPQPVAAQPQPIPVYLVPTRSKPHSEASERGEEEDDPEAEESELAWSEDAPHEEIKKIKTKPEFKKTASEAYSGYLNPFLFSPKRKRFSK
jgi:hypothetical protein